MNIEIPGENLKTLNSKLNLNENVIRYLSVKVKEFGETPTAMLKEKD
jgi:ribosomal protein S6